MKLFASVKQKKNYNFSLLATSFGR